MARLLSSAVAGFCLLSLLACVGSGWLGWRVGRGHFDYAEASAAGVYLFGASDGRGVAALAVRRWPGPAVARAGSVASWGDVAYYRVRPAAPRRWPGWAGLAGGSGELTASVRPNGQPLTWGQAEGSGAARTSKPLPYSTSYYVPHWRLAAAAALPPLLWLGLQTRRGLVLRRRKRLGLCTRCGYDLRGCPGPGRCSECGEAVIVPGGAKGVTT